MTKFEDELRQTIENGDTKYAFRAAELLLEILPELRGMVEARAFLEGRNINEGHGHVFKRPDGMRVRCGGPGMCKQCASDLSLKPDTEKELCTLTEKLKKAGVV